VTRFRGEDERALGRLIARIEEHVSELDRTLRRPATTAIAERIIAEIGREELPDTLLVGALVRAADVAVGGLLRLEQVGFDLSVSYQRAATEAERREILLRHLNATITDPVRLSRDAAATRRWLDLEAVKERITADVADRADQVAVAYAAVRSLAHALAKSAPRHRRGSLGGLSTMLSHATRLRQETVRAAALAATAAVLGALPEEERLPALGTEAFRLVRRWAEGVGADRWVQVAALELSLLAHPKGAMRLLRGVLLDRTRPDGLVVRRNALRLLAELGATSRGALAVALRTKDDPSEHVRQGLAYALARLGRPRATGALVALCLEDSSERVRAVALRELGRRAVSDPTCVHATTHAVRETLQRGAHDLDVKMAFEVIETLSVGTFAPVPPNTFVPELAELARRAALSPELLERATAVLRRLEVEAVPLLTELRERFESELATLDEGTTRRLKLANHLRLRDVERALAVAARSDMAVALRDRGGGVYAITRGEPRRLRLWRLLFELRTPVPDKRKAFAHSRARVPAGDVVIPPRGMAEVTATRVPGERHLLRAIGGWGVFLPRVDDLLAAASPFAKPLRIVTSFGTVVLRGPSPGLGRLRAWWKLSAYYEHFARERERSLEASEASERRRYASLCEELGFSVALTDSTGEIGGAWFNAESEYVLRYLPVAMAIPLWLERPVSYTLSPSGNSPWQLALVVWVVFVAYVLRAAWILSRVERARRSIPLTIGGWGTRGKSGSERLKAALFHSLRYDVVVKTTGCEAMFIHARRDLPAREIFLYRPYDKATIWEQRMVLDFASKLRTQVFLWECMALQPRFVDLLAREWMKDKITTLTNAYPDHEDVMGPSGEDVARVIGRFMPLRGTTFTSEEQMLPIIRDAARHAGTRLVEVAPMDADLIPQDLLARYPYDEHPRNIALIAALAEHLGVDREFALVMMADFVVPDLGVLKTYPEVGYAGRRMAFSNGMSANERAGFMSNWLRLAFDKHDVDREPEVVTVAVVNNRADRVPRSRVFAEIFVRDVSVDHIVCIGTNLGGLTQFVREALELFLPELKVSGDGGRERALARFDEALHRLKMPLRPDALLGSIRRMLGTLSLNADAIEEVLARPSVAAAVANAEGLGAALEHELGTLAISGEDLRADVVRHAERQANRERAVRVARSAVESALESGEFDKADSVLRSLYRELFLERVAIVERSDATGDQIVDFIARSFAPGHRARVMGCQNIKGTGLDFVYRWLSIDVIYAALRRLENEPAARREALSLLSAHTDWGLIDSRDAAAALRAIRDRDGDEWAEHKGLVAALAERLTQLHAAKLKLLGATGKKSGLDRVLGQVEPYVDHLDSMRRRGAATRLMDAVFAGRVGQGRAALLMRELVAREKGGWLAKDVRRRLMSRRNTA